MLNELQHNYNEEDINNNIKNENDNEKEEGNNSLSNNSLQNIINENISNTSKNIKVYCRFRPPNEKELSHSTNNCLILLSPQNLLFTQEKNLEIKKEYVFDGLFDINTPKEIFYIKACNPIISKFLLGYNGSIICYGETGTGKTFTIKEIIPFIITKIFEFINESDSNNELFKIEISSIEIIKEQINDLLNTNNKNLNLNQGEIINITKKTISSIEQMTEVLEEIISLRNIKENNQGHFIIEITLYHYMKRNNCLINSKLFLVDLEGSERLSKINNIINEENIEEQKIINKSLIALSIIVNNLSKENNDNYIPYRDSKLTQIIQESFGGNCYTSLILTCSKHELSSIETKNTLNFGEKAKNIENNPIINIQKDINNKKNNLFLSDIIEEENENLCESINNNINNNMNEKEKKFLKIQINQLKEIIEQDKIYIVQLNERINLLESEKKNLTEEFEQLIKNRKEEDKKDTINSEYIENNINDLHQVLNEKENNEKKMRDEINNLKLILEKNKVEISVIINKKNEEIVKIKEEQNNQMETFQELIDCLEQASNQIKIKEQKIEELLNIIENNKNNNKPEEINLSLKENKNMKDILYQNEEEIKKLKEENNILLKKKNEYENRLSGMTKLVNKIKEELDKKNINEINKENDKEKIIKENNILKNKIQSLENNINILNKEKKELEELNNKIKKESESKLNELQNEIDIKNKISIELHNIKIKYQNLWKNTEQIKLNNKNIIDNIKQELESKKKLIDEYNNKIKILQENKDKAEKEIKELKNKNEIIKTENNKIIEKLKEEINKKEMTEINSYKNMINKLKKENASLNNIVMDLKEKNENHENITKNYFNKLSNQEQKLEAKEYIINDYKAKYEQILKENLINKNNIKELEENNKTLLKNFDIIKNELEKKENKEEYIKEINNYKEILRQKDCEINELNKNIINNKITLDEIISLQKENSELKIENNQLNLIIKEFKEKNNKKEPVVYLISKDMDKEKIKNAYRTLIQENEELKNNIMKLKEYHH